MPSVSQASGTGVQERGSQGGEVGGGDGSGPGTDVDFRSERSGHPRHPGTPGFRLEGSRWLLR